MARTAASAKGKLRARQESAEIQRDEKDKARADEILKLTAKKKTLSMLKLGTLKIKAAEAGVDSDELEDVDEAEDVKGEVIRLILQTQTTDEVARECSNGRLGLRLVAVAAALTVERCCEQWPQLRRVRSGLRSRRSTASTTRPSSWRWMI